VDFPIPFPLTEAERGALGAGRDPEAVAEERAVERGRHLVQARYACTECHGANFGGGVMVDDPMLGRLLGPNITLGAGSKTLTYQASDWDRAVRHGIKPGGVPSVMPSEDFLLMSDQELADVIVYIRSVPAVDNEVLPIRMGPIGTMLVALGQLPFAADMIESHDAAHPAVPPVAAVSAEFGGHLAGVCVGCHRADFAGGPIMGGDPSWPPARNLTPHVDGLAGWTYADFRRVLLDGMRPDGTAVLEPMTLITPYAANMTDVEMEALWEYLRSVRPVARE
jgi:mono/diheme cytochrome c family protein